MGYNLNDTWIIIYLCMEGRDDATLGIYLFCYV